MKITAKKIKKDNEIILWFAIGSLLLSILFVSIKTNKQTIEGLENYPHCFFKVNPTDPNNPNKSSYYIDNDNPSNFYVETDDYGRKYRYKEIWIKENKNQKEELIPLTAAKTPQTVKKLCGTNMSNKEPYSPEKHPNKNIENDHLQKMSAIRFGIPYIPDEFIPNRHVQYSKMFDDMTSIVKEDVKDNIWCKPPETYSKDQQKAFCEIDVPHPANLFGPV